MYRSVKRRKEKKTEAAPSRSLSEAHGRGLNGVGITGEKAIARVVTVGLAVPINKGKNRYHIGARQNERRTVWSSVQWTVPGREPTQDPECAVSVRVQQTGMVWCRRVIQMERCRRPTDTGVSVGDGGQSQVSSGARRRRVLTANDEQARPGGKQQTEEGEWQLLEHLADRR